MKQWRCKVCGYIHEGEEPPDKCPVCGAPKDQFELVAADTADADSAEEGLTAEAEEGDVRQETEPTWQCQVCGYQHTGDAAPEKCQVCGAAQENFSELDSAPNIGAEANAATTSVDAAAGRPDSMQAIGRTIRPISHLVAKSELITRLHGHPIAVHIPNGLLPVSVIFTLLAALFKLEPLAIAAKYNVGFVAVSMPVVLITGFIDWFNRFGGHMTSIFKIKIACGFIVTGLTLLLALWWSVDPQIYLGGKPSFYLFMLINLANFATAAVAGFYGGKLVFKD